MEDKFRSELWASWEYRILVGAITLFTIALGIAIAFFGAPSWTAWAAGLFVVVFALAYRRFIQEHYPRAILAHQFCPACGYNLAQLDPHEDGCTVCPECGAAWRIKASG